MYEHNVQILPSTSVHDSYMQRFPLVVLCSCQWESAAPTEEAAEIIKQRHIEAHNKLKASKGIRAGGL
jgi:hypothetical protein